MNENLSILIDRQKLVIKTIGSPLNKNQILTWYDHMAKPSRGVVEITFLYGEVKPICQVQQYEVKNKL